jgi:hypothetical protein
MFLFRINSDGASQTAFAGKNLSVLPQTFFMAQKMATGLATGEILLRALQKDEPL